MNKVKRSEQNWVYNKCRDAIGVSEKSGTLGAMLI